VTLSLSFHSGLEVKSTLEGHEAHKLIYQETGVCNSVGRSLSEYTSDFLALLLIFLTLLPDILLYTKWKQKVRNDNLYLPRVLLTSSVILLLQVFKPNPLKKDQ